MRRTVSISFIILGACFVDAQVSHNTIKIQQIEEVELFGEKNKQPEGLEVITRLPLKTRDQIQSISVVSLTDIEDLDGLSVTEVAQTLPVFSTIHMYT